MDNITIKMLSNVCEIALFQKTFNDILVYSSVPYDYFKIGECHAMYDGDDMVAGFCLVRGFSNLRAIQQLPQEKIDWLSKKRMANSMADFTGYFIKDKKYGRR